jgi:hypothetical protein
VLNVASDALDRVIDAGYDPALGARAMKRAVERELTQPAAARLATLDVNELTVVTVKASGTALAVGVQAPGWAAKLPLDARAALPVRERLDAAWDALDRVDAVLDASRPKTVLTAGQVTPEHERYFALKELADAIEDTLTDYANRLEDRKRSYLEGGPSASASRRPRFARIKITRYTLGSSRGEGWHEPDQPFSSLASSDDMASALRELFEATEPLPGDQELFDLENRLALLNLMATAPADPRPVFLCVRGFPDGVSCKPAAELWRYYVQSWANDLGLELEGRTATPERPGVLGIQLKGFHARALALTEVGTHLFLPKHGGPVPLRVDVLDSWPGEVANPFAFAPIIRVYAEGQPVADVRTGLVSPLPTRSEFADTFRAFTLAALPRA